MMPWWSWLLIWTGLVLALLGVLAAFGWILVRKGLRVLRQLEALTGMLATLESEPPTDAEPRPIAILADRSELLRRYELAGRDRDERRSQRRADRIRRGKLLVKHNPITE
jgi:hypothetical protein